MFQKLLDLFPIHTHSLFLVSDPDGLLADEAVLSALLQRGFQIVQESDPILFRYRIKQLKPFKLSNPVLVITTGVLENLPYDLWQQGQQVQLALHEFFPNLAYPVIRTLTSTQRARLAQLAGPKERLGEQKTIQFVLEHVFHFASSLLDQPAHFVLWLDEFHASLAPFPPLLLESVLEQVRRSENYQDWDINALLQDRETFRLFIQHQWQGFLSIQTGKSIGEAGSAYLLNFETDQSLQDALPRLLRNGSLMPVQLETGRPLPAWVVPGVLTLDEDPRPRRTTELLAQLRETFATLTAESLWEKWKAVAYQWAELTSLRNEIGIPVNEEKDEYKELQAKLDAVFNSWLTDKYSSLATQKLPTPHHVHHVPHYMNYLRSQGLAQKVALLVMDGMSLTDWLLLKSAWASRQTNWKMKENLVLAQIPTITAVSRHALISGLRPADFYHPNAAKSSEAKAWGSFWIREGGLPENTIDLIALRLEKNDPAPEITNPRLQALCLIERQLDEIMHGSMLGAMVHQSTVNSWFSPNNSGINSTKLENVINLLLDENFTIFLSSDHGHCEAYGIGKPSEGLMAQSRGRRARLYSDRRTAEQVQIAFDKTILWEDDGLLPKNLFALLPTGRQAFSELDEIVITHGGVTMDEIVVPLIEIKKEMTIDKGLGFIRNLHLSWLDAAALARLRNSDFQSMRQDLDQHLKHEIAGDESRRKTIDVLVAIWYRSAEIDPSLFNQALDFFSKVPANERIWLHYGLTLLYYPFFRQTAAIVGQFARTGEPVTRLAVKGRLAKEIGHLGSLNRAAERVVASLVDWGALTHQKKGNIYLPQLKAFNTNNNDLQAWLLLCALSAHPSNQLPFPDLIRLPELFPMNITISLDDLRNRSSFNIQRQGMWDIVNIG